MIDWQVLLLVLVALVGWMANLQALALEVLFLTSLDFGDTARARYRRLRWCVLVPWLAVVVVALNTLVECAFDPASKEILRTIWRFADRDPRQDDQPVDLVVDLEIFNWSGEVTSQRYSTTVPARDAPFRVAGAMVLALAPPEVSTVRWTASHDGKAMWAGEIEPGPIAPIEGCGCPCNEQEVTNARL